MSKCRVCATMGQVGLNMALMADLALNSFLLGQPTETLSRRTARARAAGSRAATVFCSVLTRAFNCLPGVDRDHCTWSLEPGPSVGQEVWHWSPDVPSPPEPASALTP